MSNATPRPWEVSSAVCGEHRTETVSIYHYPNENHCVEVVESGCYCEHDVLSEEDAHYIVKCVNYHERLVENLKKWVDNWDDDPDSESRKLLEELEAEK